MCGEGKALGRAHAHMCAQAIVSALTLLSCSLSPRPEFMSLAITRIYAEPKNDSFSLLHAQLRPISPCWSVQTFQLWLQRDLKFRVWGFFPQVFVVLEGKKKASPSCYFQLLTM